MINKGKIILDILIVTICMSMLLGVEYFEHPQKPNSVSSRLTSKNILVENEKFWGLPITK